MSLQGWAMALAQGRNRVSLRCRSKSAVYGRFHTSHKTPTIVKSDFCSLWCGRVEESQPVAVS